MKILLLEPFFTGSHQQWALGFQKHSAHQVEILSLPGRHWKWRMHGAAITLAEKFKQNYQQEKFDLILATDFLDLGIFLSLTRKKTAGIPVAVYFHENQLTYPWSPSDQDVKKGRDNHYAFINYSSALVADQIFFNSNYHLQSFISELPNFLHQFPDFKNLDNIDLIQKKSEVLHLGLDLKRFDSIFTKKQESVTTLLWNHRWEYDKNPELFFNTLLKLKEEDIPFQLIVLGESYKSAPAIFEKAKKILTKEIIHWGFAASWEIYAKLLWQADILPVSSNQDFFGGSVVEAMYCKCFPILPNRLAYPEHIPKESRTSHFYSDNNAFFEKLKHTILDFPKIKHVNNYQNFVAKYDWSILATIYDNRLEKLCLH